jgi:hypothetical protein
MNTSGKIIDKRATDPLDQLIFEEGLRIKTLWFDQDLDLLVVLLNNKKIMQRPISDFGRLKNATKAQLDNYENDGIGIHWPDVDEDLSLRGFLKYELAHFTEKVA